MYIPHSNGERKIVIFSGAGLDVPSGIPAYRGDNKGIWKKYDMNIVCNDLTWKKNFNEVHEFYNLARQEIAKAKCNEYHYLIKDIYEENKDKVYNLTTNVSDFFDRLKIPTMYIHGKITEMECIGCGNKWEVGYKDFDVNTKCPKCDSYNDIKPNVVFFGGYAPMYSYMNRAFEYLQNENSLLIVIGSSSLVVDIDSIAEKVKCETILLDTNFRKGYDYYVSNTKELKELLYNLSDDIIKIK